VAVQEQDQDQGLQELGLELGRRRPRTLGTAVTMMR
jgi:hypothetical protein